MNLSQKPGSEPAQGCLDYEFSVRKNTWLSSFGLKHHLQFKSVNILAQILSYVDGNANIG